MRNPFCIDTNPEDLLRTLQVRAGLKMALKSPRQVSPSLILKSFFDGKQDGLLQSPQMSARKATPINKA